MGRRRSLRLDTNKVEIVNTPTRKRKEKDDDEEEETHLGSENIASTTK